MRILPRGPDDYRVAYDTSPTISSDSARLVYATLRRSQRPGTFGVVSSDLDGGDRRLLTDLAETSDADPAWSPDSARLAFLGDEGQSRQEHPTLFIVDDDGSDLHGSGKSASSVTAQIGAGNSEPTFSSDMAMRSVPESSATDTNVGAAVAASDGKNDALTYTLSGGDASSFTIVSLSRPNPAVGDSIVVELSDPDGGINTAADLGGLHWSIEKRTPRGVWVPRVGDPDTSALTTTVHRADDVNVGSEVRCCEFLNRPQGDGEVGGECPELGGDSDVDVLAVAGDADLKGGGRRVGSFGHR